MITTNARALGNFVLLAFTTVVVAAAMMFPESLIGLSLQDLSTLVTVGSVAALTVAWRRNGPYSASFLYLLCLSLFHFGIAYLLALRAPIAMRYRAYTALWFKGDNNVEYALYLSLLACLVFVLGNLLAAVATRRIVQPPATGDGGNALTWVGLVAVSTGSALFIGAVLMTAPSLLLTFGQYNTFAEQLLGSGPIGAGMFLVGIGAAMIAAAPPSRRRQKGLWLLGVFALLVLAMGSRTTVMYAAVGAVVAAARVNRMPHQRTALLGIVVAIFVVGGVQQIRGGGAESSNVAAAPIAAISEMGGSLRPVVETVHWREQGEPAKDGITYVAGLVRIGERLLGLPRPQEDQRFAGTLVAQRVDGYQIGYSAVAEAYLNFDRWGVFGFFGMLGLCLGILDFRRSQNRYAAARFGVLLFALTYQVRQASNIVLTIIVAGFVIIYLAEFVGRRTNGQGQAVTEAPTRIPAQRGI